MSKENLKSTSGSKSAVDGLVMPGACKYCGKELVSGRQTIVRWYEGGHELGAYHDCYKAVKPGGACPQCKSETGVKIPRGLTIYCEDCGWPDEDFVA